MQTSLTLLPAINALYDLNFTDEQIKDLGEKVDQLVDELGLKRGNKTARKISYVTLSDTMLAESRPHIPSDNNSKITLKKIKEQDREALFAQIGEGGGRFRLLIREYNPRIDLYLENLDANALRKLALWDDLAEFSQNGLDTLIRNVDTTGMYGLVDLVDGLIEEITKNWHLFNVANDGFTEIDRPRIQKVVKNIFPDAKHTQGDTKKNNRLLSRDDHLRLITDVWEFNNYRLFLIKGHWNSGYGKGSKYRLAIVPHTHRDYNYVDVGRIFSNLVSVTRYRSKDKISEEKPFAEILFTDYEPVLPKATVLETYFGEIERHPNKESGRMDNDDLRLMAKRDEQRRARLQKETDQREILRDKIEKKIAEVKNDGKELKLNGMTITSDRIEYEGQVLYTDMPGWAADAIRKLTWSWDFKDINFDMVLDSFLDYVIGKDVEGIIGDVNFKLEYKTLRNTGGVSSTRSYINGKRINQDEIRPSLQRALCYTDQDEYTYFLKEVSACSLHFHKYLQTGINISVRDYFEETDVNMKFPLTRKKGVNFLVIGENEYRIRDTGRIIGLEQKSQILDVVNVLLTDTAVTGVEPKAIKPIIFEAKKAFRNAIEKSQELLANTEKLFNLEREHIEMGDGTRKYGYLIKGKLRDYVVELDPDDPVHRGQQGVYDYKTGQYICVVDKSTAQAGLDRLVNRIFALHNDEIVAGRIGTL